MKTFWKKITALGFGVAFSLLSANAVLAAGEEGFDFTDSKSASEEAEAMNKFAKEQDEKFYLDSKDVELYINELVNDMNKVASGLVSYDVEDWHSVSKPIVDWAEVKFNIHQLRENQVRYSTNKEKQILYEGCDAIDRFVEGCLMRYYTACDWKSSNIRFELKSTMEMERWFEEKGAEYMKKFTEIDNKVSDLIELCKNSPEKGVKAANQYLTKAGLDKYFLIYPSYAVVLRGQGTFLIDMDIHSENLSKEIIEKRLLHIEVKEEELRVARLPFQKFAPQIKALPAPFNKASGLISAVEKMDSTLSEVLQAYKEILLRYGTARDPRGAFTQGYRDGYAGTALEWIRSAITPLKN